MARSKKQQTRKRKQSRRLKKQRRFFSRRGRTYRYRHRGGADLPVPEGSVIGVDLDPKDDYSVPVLISKSKYENEILED